MLSGYPFHRNSFYVRITKIVHQFHGKSVLLTVRKFHDSKLLTENERRIVKTIHLVDSSRDTSLHH